MRAIQPERIRPAMRWAGFFIAGFSGVFGLQSFGAPLAVDLSTREQSRQFYRTIYGASEGVPMGFTGDVAAARAGDTSAAFKEAVRLRVDFFRAFAGITGQIQFTTQFNVKCQQAVLMGSLNNTISHVPAASLRAYTADAADAAGHSNLALIDTGPSAITSYVRDPDPSNRDVGHRRWVLYPQTREMGTGDVPSAGSFSAANALWILDANASGPRPATRQPYVAWPPAGYVPHTLVFPRWSLSVAGADFSQAFVSVKRDGVPLAVAVGSVVSGYGENTIVWSVGGQDPNAFVNHERPVSDVSYAVEVTNVVVAGASQSYRYSVIVYDPDKASAGGAPVAVSGPSKPAVGVPNRYAVSAAPYFNRQQWRTLRFTAATPRFDAEGGAGLGGLIADTNGYNPIVTDIRGAGAAGFRLVHPPPLQFEHTLTLPDTYYAPDQSAALSFLSRLGYASARQIARVQISADDGASWSDVYSQAGTGTAGEVEFRTRSIALAGFERRTFRVRFNYTFLNGGSLFNQTDPDVGWYLDDIVLSGVRKVTASAPADVADGGFDLTPADDAELGLQARGLIDVYPAEWSSVLATTGNIIAGGTDPATPLPTPATGNARLVNLSVRTNAGRDAAALAVGFNLAGSGTKSVLIRAIGPTLGVFGVPGAITDPQLVVNTQSGTTVAQNDNWGGSATIASASERVGAFPLVAASRDAVVLPALGPGSYIATASPASADVTPGGALVELYDTDTTGSSRLANVSARAQVGTGADVLVVGFAVSGTGNRNVLIRAVGPTLAVFGVPGTLADPKLELFQGSTLIRTSNNWNPNLAPAFASVGAFPLAPNSTDAAAALALAPGTYTVQVSGVGNTTGVALVEVYELP